MSAILVVDDEEGIRSFMAEALADEGHRVDQAVDGQAALEQLDIQAYHLMFTDLKMPRLSGMELLRRVRAKNPEMEVVVLTAHGSVDTAVEAMKLGAFDYLTKPLSGPDDLRLVAGRALERRRLRDRVNVPKPMEMVAEDPVMRRVLVELDKAAATDVTVLLIGESGTGKEVAARRVHHKSPRADGPFVAVNCAALSATLLESELFGHEKGAFTGAHQRQRGRFELADGGTLLLDEVSEIKPELQAKLLRVLQERSFERVGSTRSIEVDVRIVAATNQDLQRAMAEGRFREDLFHRLAVFPVTLPPLRKRPGDIPALSDHLLGLLAARRGLPLRLEPDAKRALERHAWPGNVRELANALERAAILSEEGLIGARDLVLGPVVSPNTAETLILDGSLKQIERQAIVRALERNDGHRKQAAEQLGLGLRTLYDKIKEYDLA